MVRARRRGSGMGNGTRAKRSRAATATARESSVSADRALRVERASASTAVADVSLSEGLDDVATQIRASAKILSKRKKATKGLSG